MDFVTKLCTITEDCHYSAFLDYMLRDKLVMGINDDRIQHRLLAEKDTITFQEAFHIAVVIESVSKHLQDI